MVVRDWSKPLAWTVGIGTFVLANALRALLRSLLLPEHIRLTGFLGLAFWFAWLAFVKGLGLPMYPWPGFLE